MGLNSIRVDVEHHPGKGSHGAFYLDDCVARMEALLPEYEGRIQLIYMDPPYLTGQSFYMHLRVGEAGWQASRAGFEVKSYQDPKNRDAYLENMRRVLGLCRRLLSDTGMIFAHIDYRLHPHMRLLMDELFGEENFLNEIIWVYQTGGRSSRHFSRKHDVILFYRKTARYTFDIEPVKIVPEGPRRNHMRRHVDPDGRVYRSMKVGGKVYTYYDDEPVSPSDVWSDLSHLQQRDPERTGYDTQKPLTLLQRIVKCASRPGDWVLDPFAGSGTTLEAAKSLERNFIGVDSQPLTANIVRRRLRGADYTLNPAPVPEGVALCEAEAHTGIGFYHIRLKRFEAAIEGLSETVPMDFADNWSAGYIRNGRYEVMVETARSRKCPVLERELKVPMYAGQLVVCVSDVLGRSWYYALNPAEQG